MLDNSDRRHNEATRRVSRFVAVFHAMTWTELDAYVAMITRNIQGLDADLAVVARINKLRDMYPESDGPAEAIAAMGITLEEWLAS